MGTEDRKVDHDAITQRQKTTWSTGDFNAIARKTMAMSEALVDAVDPRAGQRVLDLACGSGNAALILGRRDCDVTGVDYVPGLIERARARAEAEGSAIDFHVADVQALPFPDASFDAVVSVLGVMFAPDQERAASELLRICRPGGTIGLACWMPEAFGGDFFAAHARHVPPPPGLTPPTRWGTEAGLQELLGHGIGRMQSERRATYAYYRSIDHAVQLHRTYFGPTKQAFRTVGSEGEEYLRNDLEAMFRRYDRSGDSTAVVEYAYLQTVAVRR